MNRNDQRNGIEWREIENKTKMNCERGMERGSRAGTVNGNGMKSFQALNCVIIARNYAVCLFQIIKSKIIPLPFHCLQVCLFYSLAVSVIIIDDHSPVVLPVSSASSVLSLSFPFASSSAHFLISKDGDVCLSVSFPSRSLYREQCQASNRYTHTW